MIRRTMKRFMILVLVFVLLMGTIPMTGFADPPYPLEGYTLALEEYILEDPYGIPMDNVPADFAGPFVPDSWISIPSMPDSGIGIDYAQLYSGGVFQELTDFSQLAIGLNTVRVYFYSLIEGDVYKDFVIVKVDGPGIPPTPPYEYYMEAMEAYDLFNVEGINLDAIPDNYMADFIPVTRSHWISGPPMEFNIDYAEIWMGSDYMPLFNYQQLMLGPNQIRVYFVNPGSDGPVYKTFSVNVVEALSEPPVVELDGKDHFVIATNSLIPWQILVDAYDDETDPLVISATPTDNENFITTEGTASPYQVTYSTIDDDGLTDSVARNITLLPAHENTSMYMFDLYFNMAYVGDTNPMMLDYYYEDALDPRSIYFDTITLEDDVAMDSSLNSYFLKSGETSEIYKNDQFDTPFMSIPFEVTAFDIDVMGDWYILKDDGIYKKGDTAWEPVLLTSSDDEIIDFTFDNTGFRLFVYIETMTDTDIWGYEKIDGVFELNSIINDVSPEASDLIWNGNGISLVMIHQNPRDYYTIIDSTYFSITGDAIEMERMQTYTNKKALVTGNYLQEVEIGVMHENNLNVIDDIVFELSDVGLEYKSEQLVLSPLNDTVIKQEWDSSDSSVVTVDHNGLINAVRDGKATISITIDGTKKDYYDEINVIVNEEREVYLEYTNNTRIVDLTLEEISYMEEIWDGTRFVNAYINRTTGPEKVDDSKLFLALGIRDDLPLVLKDVDKTAGLETGFYDAKVYMKTKVKNEGTDQKDGIFTYLPFVDNFTLNIKNSPPHVNFYENILRVTKGAQNIPENLGWYMFDPEGDAITIERYTDSGNVIDNKMIITDEITNSHLTYGFKNSDIEDAEEVMREREIFISNFEPENSVVVVSTDHIVAKNMTTQAFEVSGWDYLLGIMDAEIVDVAMNASGEVVTLTRYLDGSYRFFIRHLDGEVSMYEIIGMYNFEGLAFDAYDDLYSIVTDYYAQSPEWALTKIIFSEVALPDTSFGSVSLEPSAYVNDNAFNIPGGYFEDFAFTRDDDFYGIYSVTGGTQRMMRIHLSDKDFGYMPMGHRLEDIDSEHGVTGIAMYNDYPFLTYKTVDSEALPTIPVKLNFYDTNTELRHYPDFNVFQQEPVEVPNLYDYRSQIDRYMTYATGAASKFNVDFDFPEIIELEGGFDAIEIDYEFDLNITPHVYNAEDLEWSLANDTGVFTFDPIKQEVISENVGVGTISLTIDGLTKTAQVIVTEKDPNVIYDNPLFLEVGGKVNGYTGFEYDYPKYLSTEIRVLDGTFTGLGSFEFDTSIEDFYQVEYRVYLPGEVEDAVHYTRDINVVDTQLKDVIVHISDPHRGPVLFYETKFNGTTTFVHGGEIENLYEYNLYSVKDVAIDNNYNLFLISEYELFTYNPDSKEIEIWNIDDLDWYIREMYVNGLTFDYDNNLYMTSMNRIYKCVLDYDTKSITSHEVIEIEDEGTFFEDLIVTKDGSMIYAVGSYNQYAYDASIASPEQGNFIKAINTETMTVVDETHTNADSGLTLRGLSFKDSLIHVASNVYEDMLQRGFYWDEDLDLNWVDDSALYMPLFVRVMSGSASVYETEITAVDMLLEIGYQKTTTDGQKYINYIVLPSERENYPVTYELAQGVGIVSLDNSGLVKGLNAGNAKVKVSVDGVSTFVDIVVKSYSNQQDPITVSLTPDPIEVEYGPGGDPEKLSNQASAVVSGSTNQNVTWSMGDETVATVDANGLVTAIQTGETTLTVRSVDGNATDTSKVIVFFVDKELDPLGFVEFNGPYVSGYPDETFGPQKPVTRAELATMFARILNLELKGYETPSYNDLNTNHWAYNYIEAASKAGIFSGYETGDFKPDQAVSRGELAATVAKYWQYFEYGADQTPHMINDVLPTYWASNYIYMMYNAGLVSSFSDNTYRPETSTLREHIVVILNILISREGLETTLPSYPDVNLNHPQLMDIEAATKTVIKKVDQ